MLSRSIQGVRSHEFSGSTCGDRIIISGLESVWQGAGGGGKGRGIREAVGTYSYLCRIDGLQHLRRRRSISETASHTTQCRSRPVSGSGLPKTGIFPMWAGDYRLFRAQIVQIASIETESQFTQSRNWRALIGIIDPHSLVERLPGWGGRIRTSAWWNQNQATLSIYQRPF